MLYGFAETKFLLEGATSNSTASFDVKLGRDHGPSLLWGTLYVEGTWDGAAINLRLQGHPGGAWIDVYQSPFSENTLLNLEAKCIGIQAELSSAGASTDLTCVLVHDRSTNLLAR